MYEGVQEVKVTSWMHGAALGGVGYGSVLTGYISEVSVAIFLHWVLQVILASLLAYSGRPASLPGRRRAVARITVHAMTRHLPRDTSTVPLGATSALP